MPVILLTKENLKSLEDGDYLVIKNGVVDNMFRIKNAYDDASPIYYVRGSDDSFAIQEFIDEYLNLDLHEYRIINANEIKLINND